MVLFGVDNLPRHLELLRGRVALVTAPSGRTAGNESTIDALARVCELVLLLAPEHGVRGDKAAGALFDDEVDPESGIPVASLYNPGSKHLSADAAQRFDTLVYDIQDVGCRYYTFISTLRYLIADCAAYGKRLVVLDRPDPLGDRVEGGMLRQDCASFVGGYDLPVRYGLTCGELARMIDRETGCGCDLHVVPCTGLRRDMTFGDWGRYWIMPSLGIPRFETALLYPGTCLIEGTNLSEGRGTAAPFEIIGAPYIRAESLCRAFNAMELPGVTATPVYFTPTSSKHQGVLCGGIHIHIVDERAVEPVELGVRLLDLIRRMYPGDFAFLPPVREGGKPFISLLAGHRDFEDPHWDPDEILNRYARESEAFRERKRPYHIY